MLSGGDVGAIFWLFFGAWVLFNQILTKEMRGLSSNELPSWLYQQKEELLMLITCFWQLCEYLQEKQKAKDAENRIVKDTLNVSVNGLYMQKSRPALQFRTLQEISPSAVVADKVLLKRVEELAEKTKEAEPFLRFDSNNKVDQEINKAVGNFLSSRSEDGHLAKDMGLPVREVDYIFGLTYERPTGPGADKIAAKLRLMLVREETLQAIYDGWCPKEGDPTEVELPKLVNEEVHIHRWNVLLCMARGYCDKTSTDHGWMKWNKVCLVSKCQGSGDRLATMATHIEKRGREGEMFRSQKSFSLDQEGAAEPPGKKARTERVDPSSR